MNAQNSFATMPIKVVDLNVYYVMRYLFKNDHLIKITTPLNLNYHDEVYALLTLITFTDISLLLQLGQTKNGLECPDKKLQSHFIN